VIHKPQVVKRVTQRLSKASPGVYRSYRMINMTCFIYLACVDYVLCVGSCMIVISCMVVLFHMYPCCKCFTFL
jgi:hypothetical protein